MLMSVQLHIPRNIMTNVINCTYDRIENDTREILSSKNVNRVYKKSPWASPCACRRPGNSTMFNGWGTRYSHLHTSNPSRSNIKITL